MGKKVKKAVKKRQFSVYLDDSLCQSIERRADQEDRSTNYIIEKVLQKAEKVNFI